MKVVYLEQKSYPKRMCSSSSVYTGVQMHYENVEYVYTYLKIALSDLST